MGSSQAIMVDAMGWAKLSASPSWVYAPLNWLQPSVPLTVPSAPNESVTVLPATGKRPLSALNTQLVPAKSGGAAASGVMGT